MTARGSSLSRFVRAAVFAVLAVMLVMRVGPICEAVAVAAVPGASAMAACEGDGHRAPTKKAAEAICSTPCAVAVDGAPIARVAALPFTAIAPWPVDHAGLAGLPDPPATPPPQTV